MTAEAERHKVETFMTAPWIAKEAFGSFFLSCRSCK